MISNSNYSNSTHTQSAEPSARHQLEIAIEREVRNLRNKFRNRISDLAETTGVLSKVENGMMSPSPTTLQALTRALIVPVSTFVRRYKRRGSVHFVKAGEDLAVDRSGTRSGH